MGRETWLFGDVWAGRHGYLQMCGYVVYNGVCSSNSHAVHSKTNMYHLLTSLYALPDINADQGNCRRRRIDVFRGPPAEKFIWNSHILKELHGNVHPDWMLRIMHGFVGQSSIFSTLMKGQCCDQIKTKSREIIFAILLVIL